jgi:hypothetical protein
MSKLAKAPKLPKDNPLSQSIVAVRPELNWRYIENKEPKMAAYALELLSEGVSYEEVRKQTGIGFLALTSLRTRHETAIDERRKQLALDGFEQAERMRALVAKKAEMLFHDEDALKKTNIKDLALAQAITQDKALQAAGENRVVVEHRTGKPSLEDAMKAIAEARAVLQKEAIPVEVVTAETRSVTNKIAEAE